MPPSHRGCFFASWEELIEVSKKIQAENPDMLGFAFGGSDHVSTRPYLLDRNIRSGDRALISDRLKHLNQVDLFDHL